MAKIQLGKPPKTITKELSFPMLDGTVGAIAVDFKYRSRKEFAALVDAQLDDIKLESEAEIAAGKEKIAAATAAAKADPDAVTPLDFGISNTVLNEKKAKRQVEYIMDAVSGWNLDVPFDKEAVEQLVDELPLAAETIIRSYREAMTEGRLGN